MTESNMESKSNTGNDSHGHLTNGEQNDTSNPLDSSVVVPPPPPSSPPPQPSTSSTSLDRPSSPGRRTRTERRRRRRRTSPILEDCEEEEMQDTLLPNDTANTNQRHSHHKDDRRRRVGSPSNNRSPSPVIEASDKTRKRIRLSDPETKQRGQRMLGLLNSTLTKFKTESEKQSSGDAARRRASLEARLQEKLRKQSETITQARKFESELKNDLETVRSLAEMIALQEAEHQTQRAFKRRMASFLWTSGNVESDLPRFKNRAPPPSSQSLTTTTRSITKTSNQEDRKRIATQIPSSIPPISRRANEKGDYPLYYLPAKMLATQEDILDEQEDQVDDEIDLMDDEWDHQRDRLEHQLRQLKKTIRAKRSEFTGASRGSCSSLQSQDPTPLQTTMDLDDPPQRDSAQDSLTKQPEEKMDQDDPPQNSDQAMLPVS